MLSKKVKIGGVEIDHLRGLAQEAKIGGDAVDYYQNHLKKK